MMFLDIQKLKELISRRSTLQKKVLKGIIQAEGNGASIHAKTSFQKNFLLLSYITNSKEFRLITSHLFEGRKLNNILYLYFFFSFDLTEKIQGAICCSLISLTSYCN